MSEAPDNFVPTSRDARKELIHEVLEEREGGLTLAEFRAHRARFAPAEAGE